MTSHASEEPMGLALVVCDTVIEDRHSGKKSLIGLFDRLHAPTFPCVHPTLSVMIALTNVSGELPCEITCRHAESGETAFAATGKVNFQDPGKVVELVFNFAGVRLPKPGKYDLNVMVDEMLIMTRPLWVLLHRPPPPTAPE